MKYQSSHEFRPLIVTFDVFESTKDAEKTGDIALPRQGERKIDSHSVTIVGCLPEERKFIFRNSYGESWGNKGNGTLPFEYLERGLVTSAFSILLKEEIPIIDSGKSSLVSLSLGNRIIIDEPRPFGEVSMTFNLSGWISKKWLGIGKGNIREFSLELINMEGTGFMTSTVELNIPAGFEAKIRRRFYFSKRISFLPMSIPFIQKSGGRIVLKVYGKDEERQSIFVPVIVTKFRTIEHEDSSTIRKHGRIKELIDQYKKDITAFYQKMEEVARHRKEIDGEANQKFCFHVNDPLISSGIYKMLQSADNSDEVNSYDECDRLEKELEQKYKAALVWRGPLAKGMVGSLNGFVFTVYSDDHDKHFHIIHRGKGINARFSFPEINLMSYVNMKNKIGSKEIAKIKKYFVDPENFERLTKEFERRDGI